MTAIADITINNGATTPVPNTFEVSGVSQSRVDYAFKTDANAHTVAGRRTVSISNRPLKNGTGNYKATVLVRIPKLSEGLSEGEATHEIKYVCTAKMEFIIPATSIQADMNDLLAYAKNVLSDAQVISTVTDELLPY